MAQESNNLGWWLRAVLAVAAVPAAGWVIWALPMWLLVLAGARDRLTPEQWFKACADARTLFVQLLGGAGLLFGLVLNARGLANGQKAQAAERYNRAVGQLGDSMLSVRMGAIYALESIAKDWPEEWWAPVMRILAAHVRTNRPLRNPDETGLDPFPEEFQAVLDIFGRADRPVSCKAPFALQNIDLRGARLAGKGWTQVAKGRSGAALFGSDLRGADLEFVHLAGGLLIGSRLERASLKHAHLEAADFTSAHLEGADLTNAHLDRADLQFAHMSGSILMNAHLEGADLRGAMLENSHLGGALLAQARLNSAYLEGARLREAHGLTQEQLDTAYGTPRSLPEGLRPPPIEPTPADNAGPTPKGVHP